MPQKKKLNGSDNDSKWSMLAPDLIRLVLVRLNFIEFHRARYISSNWYSTSESCIIQNPTPWLILFSNDNDISCKLYDPHHNKTYIVRDLGLDFHRSRCLASSGSWFLMLDLRTDFYILNLFTRERIHLPTLEAIEGSQMKFERVSESDEFLETFTYDGIKLIMKNAVLWVDERSGDYLVVWNLQCFFTYHKKGDSNMTWKVFQPLNYQGCADMVLRETKLYVLSKSENITVFYFSGGDSPKECASFASPDDNALVRGPKSLSRLVITSSGDVLTIITYGLWGVLNVYKMDTKSSKWRKIDSIGNEALFFDLGTTVETKDGFMANGFWLSNYGNAHRCNGISLCKYLYQIRNWKIVPQYVYLAASSPMHIKDARWFFPNFWWQMVALKYMFFLF